MRRIIICASSGCDVRSLSLDLPSFHPPPRCAPPTSSSSQQADLPQIPHGRRKRRPRQLEQRAWAFHAPCLRLYPAVSSAPWESLGRPRWAQNDQVTVAYNAIKSQGDKAELHWKAGVGLLRNHKEEASRPWLNHDLPLHRYPLGGFDSESMIISIWEPHFRLPSRLRRFKEVRWTPRIWVESAGWSRLLTRLPMTADPGHGFSPNVCLHSPSTPRFHQIREVQMCF
ncbi:hypothetical protein BKA70DRAFT_1465431 [Coprinopsis sp. MPI-PUGE-AT-0042]|nr:hypothetical protein BKA70DRAFT_1465431 [Coprinopsis sp. MPI-PUGE-AT-0042]